MQHSLGSNYLQTCDVCGFKRATRGAVVKGHYVKSVCEKCLSTNRKVSSGSARWSRTIDVEDHAADLMQPYNADGTINVDFCTLYPTQASALFNDEQIAKATRA